MTTAIYVRVSSGSQDTASQDRELKAWAGNQTDEVIWYRDKATGKNFDRPGWLKLEKDIAAGKITRLVVWRLDRLGRTAGETITLFDRLESLGVVFVSMREGIDASTPSGRLMRNILASYAQFETEVRSERQRAGIEAVREANGGKCTWGGRKVGTRIRVTEEKERAILDMNAAKKPISEIARITELTRPTVYRVLGKFDKTKVLKE
jgi:DNA invertase Pin-like site-specific DNA recombinase